MMYTVITEGNTPSVKINKYDYKINKNVKEREKWKKNYYKWYKD